MSRVPRSAAAEAEDLRNRLEAAGAEALDTADCLAFALRRGAGAQAAGWAERRLGEFGSLAEVLGASRAALRLPHARSLCEVRGAWAEAQPRHRLIPTSNR